MSKLEEYLAKPITCLDRNARMKLKAEATAELVELQAENKKLCDLLTERYKAYLKVCADNQDMRDALEYCC
jgi:hypothetical protein